MFVINVFQVRACVWRTIIFWLQQNMHCYFALREVKKINLHRSKQDMDVFLKYKKLSTKVYNMIQPNISFSQLVAEIVWRVYLKTFQILL